jgi:hypothetical protein
MFKILVILFAAAMIAIVATFVITKRLSIVLAFFTNFRGFRGRIGLNGWWCRGFLVHLFYLFRVFSLCVGLLIVQLIFFEWVLKQIGYLKPLIGF